MQHVQVILARGSAREVDGGGVAPNRAEKDQSAGHAGTGPFSHSRLGPWVLLWHCVLCEYYVEYYHGLSLVCGSEWS